MTLHGHDNVQKVHKGAATSDRLKCIVAGKSREGYEDGQVRGNSSARRQWDRCGTKVVADARCEREQVDKAGKTVFASHGHDRRIVSSR